jgi:hypothetical protein
VGAPFPARVAWCSSLIRASGVVAPFASTPAPARVAGWGALPTPGLGGWPSPTRGRAAGEETVAAGCHVSGCGPDPVPSLLQESRGHANPWAGAGDQWNRDMSCVGAADVTFRPIIAPGSGGGRVGNADHSRSHGTPPRRFRRGRACPRVGDGRSSDHMIRWCTHPGHWRLPWRTDTGDHHPAAEQLQDRRPP